MARSPSGYIETLRPRRFVSLGTLRNLFRRLSLGSRLGHGTPLRDNTRQGDKIPASMARSFSLCPGLQSGSIFPLSQLIRVIFDNAASASRTSSSISSISTDVIHEDVKHDHESGGRGSPLGGNPFHHTNLRNCDFVYGNCLMSELEIPAFELNTITEDLVSLHPAVSRLRCYPCLPPTREPSTLRPIDSALGNAVTMRRSLSVKDKQRRIGWREGDHAASVHQQLASREREISALGDLLTSEREIVTCRDEEFNAAIAEKESERVWKSSTAEHARVQLLRADITSERARVKSLEISIAGERVRVQSLETSTAGERETPVIRVPISLAKGTCAAPQGRTGAR